MPTEVIMPKVDMDMTHGKMAIWHVAEGDLVEKGAALFDIETDKAAMEVEAPATGRLHHISALPGDKVAVGATVGWLYSDKEAVSAAPLSGGPAPAVQTPPPPLDQSSLGYDADARPLAAAPSSTLRATPAARRTARDAGIRLVGLSGSGPLGRIQRDDVVAAVANSAATRDAPASWSPEPGPLHVTRRPGEGPPVVLLHGFAADSKSWAALEKALRSTHPLISIDLPGHGLSPKRRISGFADLARMMVDAFDDATRNMGAVHLIGHSVGGALALALADIRGRRVASLSLIAPAGLGPEIDVATLAGIVRATRIESLAPWLRRLTARPESISDDYVRAAMATRRDPALRACQADMAAALFPDSVQAFDLHAALARLDCPTQILWGRSDHILPYRHALAVDGDFAIHLLQGAGHIPHVECPDRIARVLARFIAGAETLV